MLKLKLCCVFGNVNGIGIKAFIKNLTKKCAVITRAAFTIVKLETALSFINTALL